MPRKLGKIGQALETELKKINNTVDKQGLLYEAREDMVQVAAEHGLDLDSVLKYAAPPDPGVNPTQ